MPNPDAKAMTTVALVVDNAEVEVRVVCQRAIVAVAADEDALPPTPLPAPHGRTDGSEPMTGL